MTQLCACTLDLTVWRDRQCSRPRHTASHCHIISARSRLALQKMRRAPSVTSSKSIPTTAVKKDDIDITFGTDSPARTTSDSSPQAKTKMQKSSFTIFGLQPSPELLSISMVYFVQGILGLARLAISFFYKDEFHLDPATVRACTLSQFIISKSSVKANSGVRFHSNRAQGSHISAGVVAWLAQHHHIYALADIKP